MIFLNKRTNQTWPTTWFVPRLTGTGAFTDVYSVMANWGQTIGVATYGHVGADLITLASIHVFQSVCTMSKKKTFSVQVLGVHLVKIKKVKITVLVQTLVLYIVNL